MCRRLLNDIRTIIDRYVHRYHYRLLIKQYMQSYEYEEDHMVSTINGFFYYNYRKKAITSNTLSGVWSR
jgi:hypothetical protein